MTASPSRVRVETAGRAARVAVLRARLAVVVAARGGVCGTRSAAARAGPAVAGPAVPVVVLRGVLPAHAAPAAGLAVAGPVVRAARPGRVRAVAGPVRAASSRVCSDAARTRVRTKPLVVAGPERVPAGPAGALVGVLVVRSRALRRVRAPVRAATRAVRPVRPVRAGGSGTSSAAASPAAPARPAGKPLVAAGPVAASRAVRAPSGHCSAAASRPAPAAKPPGRAPGPAPVVPARPAASSGTSSAAARTRTRAAGVTGTTSGKRTSPTARKTGCAASPRKNSSNSTNAVRPSMRTAT